MSKTKSKKQINTAQRVKRRLKSTAPHREANRDVPTVVTDGVVTHVMLPIDEYENLIFQSMAVEVLDELEHEALTGQRPGDFVNGEDFAAEVAAEALLNARKEKGLTQQQLAKKVGIPQSQISRIERNPDRTTVKTMRKIAKALGVDVSRILPR